jgi:hypothetical protein
MEKMKTKLVMSIGSSSTIEDALDTYRKFGALIPEYKFIFSSSKGTYPGFETTKKFQHGASIRTLFSTERVFVLDKITISEMYSEVKRSDFKIDYSISLDTQSLSYLERFIDGAHGLPKDMDEVFNFIAHEDTSVDSVLYELENLSNIDDENKHAVIYRKLKGYEFIKNVNNIELAKTGRISTTLSEGELYINTDNHFSLLVKRSKNKEFRRGVNERNNYIYSYLLMASIIQLESPAMSLKNKLLKMLSFAHSEIGMLALHELIIIKKFFEDGTNFRFFNKIHKNSPKIWNALSGMVWDLSHYRYLEGAITYDMHNNSRYFFPAILTFDKGFIEVMELTPLKAIAFSVNENRPITFYHDDIESRLTGDIPEVLTFFEDLASVENRKIRNDLHKGDSTERLAVLIRNLESTLESIAGVMKKH